MNTSSAVPKRHDPYLIWAFSTGFRHVVDGPDGAIRLAGQLRSGYSLAQAMEAVGKVGDTSLRARQIAQSRFFTATMTHPTLKACDALLEHATFVLAQPGMKAQDAMPPERTPLAPDEPTRSNAPQAVEQAVEQGIVVGIIDGRCGFANEAFCAGSQSRLTRYWDQEGSVQAGATSLGMLWKGPPSAGYGRELDRQALDKIAQHASSAGPGNARRAEVEKGLYRELGHHVPVDADWSHGSHMLGTVLGELKATVDPALVYVQLPDPAVRDTSARWAAAYVLDAIDYILRCANNDAKVIINLSMGAFAGPHDGSSLLERALDAIAEQSEGRVTFVVAAGNAGKVTDDGTGQIRRCHAQLTLANGDSRDLLLDIDRSDDCESFVELWARSTDGTPFAGITVSLQHVDHANITTAAVAPDGQQAIETTGAVVASVINSTGRVAIPNGAAGLALLAFGNTHGTGAPSASMGRWSIQLTNPGPGAVDLDAWIERRDVPGELAGYRPQYGFVEDPLLNESRTMATLANGNAPVVVGALELDADPGRYRIADYSSRGPSLPLPNSAGEQAATPRLSPDVYALGVRKSDGYFSGTTKKLAGTSVAAACVTAAIASALADPATADRSARVALARLVQARWKVASNASVHPGLERSSVVLPP